MNVCDHCFTAVMSEFVGCVGVGCVGDGDGDGPGGGDGRDRDDGGYRGLDDPDQ